MASFRKNKARAAIAHSDLAQQLEAHARRFRLALDSRDYAVACVAAQAALKIVPRHMAVLSDYAFCLMRLSRYKESYAVYRKIYNAPQDVQRQASPTWLDGMTEVCGWLGRNDEVMRYGLESLTSADVRCAGDLGAPLPLPSPPEFDSEGVERNVIAYTLFGDSPRYCESAITNVYVAKELFAQWRCRVYLDDSVPSAVRQRLIDAGADVIDMTGAAGQGLNPLMWRFLVADDPRVDRFLIRDADSLLCEREQAAVQQWLASPYWFHHMRDYFTHTELILAGLWGGCRGVLPPMRSLMQEWLARQGNVTRFVDQQFLREMVWPTLRLSVLNHDECFGFHNAYPYPKHYPIRWQTNNFHVGSNASYQGIEGLSEKADGERQNWSVHDQQGAALFSYSSVVSGGKWRADLPFYIVEQLSTQAYKVAVSP